MTKVFSGPRLVAPGLYQLRLPIPAPMKSMNAYLIETRQGLALVDCGTRTNCTWDAMVQMLDDLGHRVTDIRTILITHFHSEHYGQVGVLQQRSGARVVMHAETDKMARKAYGDEALAATIEEWTTILLQAGAPPDDLEELRRTRVETRDRVALGTPDRVLGDGEAESLDGWAWRAVVAPGHAPGHTCFYEPSRRILIAGDLILPGAVPYVGLTPFGTGNPLRDYFQSLERVYALDVDLLLPGHGADFPNCRQRIEEIRAYHHAQRRATLRVMGRAGKTAYEVAADHRGLMSTFFHRRNAAIEHLAQLEMLVEEEALEKTTSGGVARYRLVG